MPKKFQFILKVRFDYFTRLWMLYFLLLHPIVFGQEEEEMEKPELGSMQKFPGGMFLMGTNDPEGRDTCEYPIRNEITKPFYLDRYPVTNKEFETFVRQTYYHRTDADDAGYSYVFFTHADLSLREVTNAKIPAEPWWIPIAHTRWNQPLGQGSNINGFERNPVVHVGLADALAYCQWKGKRLPTEFEWEFAARSNNNTDNFPWGDWFRHFRSNVWEGLFPVEDKGWDGYNGLSPVDNFPAQNAHGMYDMIGNVWEWTVSHYHCHDTPQNTRWYVLRGGSFLDMREDEESSGIVRSSARMGKPGMYTAENVGFRCAKAVPPELPKPTPEPPLIRFEDTWEYKLKQKELIKNFEKLKEHQEVLSKSGEL